MNKNHQRGEGISSQSQLSNPETTIFTVITDPQHFRKIKWQTLVLPIMLIIFVILSLGCSAKKQDVNSVMAMQNSITKKALGKLHEGDIHQWDWLTGPVLYTLLLEAKIIQDGGVDNLPDGITNGDIRTKLKDRKLIRLYDYNHTLSETLTSAEYKHLMEIRIKYGYAQFFDSATQK